MNDKELLELAAKAAGLTSHRYCDAWKTMAMYTHMDGYFGPSWNPLADDGDALRLAVKLNLDISFGFAACQINVEQYDWADDCTSVDVHENGKVDPYTATRLAIVRAAAEIGKGML